MRTYRDLGCAIEAERDHACRNNPGSPYIDPDEWGCIECGVVGRGDPPGTNKYGEPLCESHAEEFDQEMREHAECLTVDLGRKPTDTDVREMTTDQQMTEIEYRAILAHI